MTTAVAVQQQISFDEMIRMADTMAKSGLFGMKNSDQALALMLVAQSEQQHPATISQDYDIIQGKATRKTHSVLARFQAAGGSIKWNELSETKADASFSHPSGGTLRMEWTFEQAKRAGLTGKDNWKNYPRAMLRARCIAEGVRAVYPAAIGGMMVPEEAMDMPTVRDMGMADEVVATPPPPPARPELTPYPQESFDANFTAWKAAVQSGRQTADRLIAMVSTKGVLSDAQKTAIRNLEVFDASPIDGQAAATSDDQQ